MNLILSNLKESTTIDDSFLETLKSHSPNLALHRVNKGSILLHSKILGRSILLSRLIMNCPVDDGFDVDHIDGNILNNTKDNLRVAKQSQNCANRGKCAGNWYSSKYKNVSWSKKSKAWYVRITAQCKTIDGGYFKDEIDAAKQADILMIQYHGEFARLNFPKT